MIKTLYEVFQRWSDGGSVYLFSDPHFGDPNCKLMDENWPDPDEQVKIINSCAGKNDTLICLGDVGDISYVPKLKAGNKVLLLGNHDAGASVYQKEDSFIPFFAEDRAAYDLYIESGFHVFNNSAFTYAYKTNGLFDEVYTGPLFIAEKILLSHEPVGVPFALNIHGHDHGGGSTADYKVGCHYLNVTANIVGYKPVSLGEIIKDGALSGIRGIHRNAIDKRGK